MANKPLMDDKDIVGRVLDKLDKVDSRLNDIDKTLVRNTVSLEEHMKRSDNLEKMITKVESDMLPLQKHVSYMHGAFKLVGVLSLVVGLLVGISKLIK